MHKKPPASSAARRAFAHVVRQERTRCKLSQEDFAEKCELHRNTVGMIERGELSPTLDNLLAIAAALKITPSTLLSRAGL